MYKHPYQDQHHDETAVEKHKREAIAWIEDMKDKEDGALIVKIIMQQLHDIKIILQDIVEKHKIYMEQIQKQLQQQDERLQKFEEQEQQKEVQKQKLEKFLQDTVDRRMNNAPKPRI